MVASTSAKAALGLCLSWLCVSGCNVLLGNEEPQWRPVLAEDIEAGIPADAATDTGCGATRCEALAECVLEAGGPSCRCRAGYQTQPDGSCRDLDECASERGGCDDNATCINLPGSRECACKTGFQHALPGDDSCVALCAEAQCDAHASCTIVSDRALCTCLAPYIGNGLTCQLDETCASHRCDQNARCLGGGPNPCVCSDGFEGDGLTCSRVDACSSQLCQHGGVCSNQGGSFTCDCTNTGYRGTSCEAAIDDCAQNPCTHGVCSDRVNGYACTCEAGYAGTNCEQDLDDCAANPCRQGTCQDLANDYKCLCPEGYSGKNCDNDIDNCAGQPCAHGTCTDQVNGYSCACPAGYDGSQCENNIDECAPQPCEHGTCTDQVAGFVCSCAPGYAGSRCETDVDDCSPNPCQHGGVCTDGVNGYSCACPSAWAGTKCETGSCAKATCPSEAPCRVPTGQGGLCYPSDCGSMAGLCLAEASSGGGAASTELLTEKNDSFNFGSGNNWNKRARYYSYIKAVKGWKHMCVFPEVNQAGTPVIIPLGTRSAPSANPFGASNAGPGEKNCPQ